MTNCRKVVVRDAPPRRLTLLYVTLRRDCCMTRCREFVVEMRDAPPRLLLCVTRRREFVVKMRDAPPRRLLCVTRRREDCLQLIVTKGIRDVRNLP